MKKLFFIGLCLGFIFAAAETASAQFCKPNANQVAIFNDANYGGMCKILNPREYPTPQSMGMPNDSVSSIMVGANVEVVLCADNDFQGACETFGSNNDFLGNTSVGNDNVSSMRIVMKAGANPAPQPAPAQGSGGPFCRPNANQVAIFNDSNYGGTCKILNPGDFRTPQSMGMPNDSVSSIMVGANVEAQLCADDNFQGTCDTFDTNNDFLGNASVGNDNVSSMRIVRKNNASANANPAPAPPRPAPTASSAPYTGPDVFKNKASFTPCAPEPGWKTCLEMADPNIKIYGSRLASASALNAVVNIYTTMTHSLSGKYPRNKFDGYKVYLVNGEPWVGELINVGPINALSSDKTGPNSGEYLRGGAATGSWHWMDEQMICKTGVATRLALGQPPDTQRRTLDQVVHEFAHSIMGKYIPMQTITTAFKVPNQPNFPPVERFAWAVQNWFATPAGSLSPAEDRVMNDLFSSRVSFTCDGYKP